MMQITSMAHAIVDWLLRTSWQVALVVAAVLVVQWLFDRRLPARWRYAMWGLVVLRLAMPVLPGTRASMFNLLPDEPRPMVAHVPATVVLSYMPAPDSADLPALGDVAPKSAPAGGMELDWRLAGAGLWMAGALVMSIAILLSHLRLTRRIARSGGAADAAMLALLARCKQEMGVARPVELVISPVVSGPAVMSVLRPKLLLPAGLARTLGRDELRFIFLHELAHLKRWDLALDWVLTALRAIHWFNPVVWLAMSRLRADRELARDAMVLGIIQPREQHRYGHTMLDLVEHLARPAAAPGLIAMTEGMG